MRLINWFECARPRSLIACWVRQNALQDTYTTRSRQSTAPAATLYASIAICAALLIFLAIASSSSDSDNRGSGRRGGGMGFMYFPDFWLLTDDSARRQGRRRRGGGGRARGEEQPADVGMGFMQAVTSWVFGDGDPNAGFDDARWAAAATYIQEHGGVVAAEEMRPFLDHIEDHSVAGVRR